MSFMFLYHSPVFSVKLLAVFWMHFRHVSTDLQLPVEADNL